MAEWRKWLLSALAGTLVAGGVVFAALPGAAARAYSGLTSRVSRQDFACTVEATGELRADAVTEVLSPLSGRVLLYLAPEGSSVRAGDVIARLDAEDLEDSLLDTEGQIAAARADLAAAQASLEETKADLAENLKDLEAQLRVATAKEDLEESKPLPEERKAAEADAAEADAEAAFQEFWLESTHQLYAEGAASGQDVEAARNADAQARLKRENAHRALAELLKGARRSALETAKAQQEQARLSLEAARGTVDKQAAQDQTWVSAVQDELNSLEAARSRMQKEIDAAIVRAPQDGVVFAHPGHALEVGYTVNQGVPLRELADAESVYFAARVREPDSPLVRQGQPAEVKLLSAPGSPLRGTVSRVGKALTEDDHAPGVRYLEVEVKLDHVPAGLRPGLTGRATIEVKRIGNALVIPVAALQGETVEVLGPTGPAVRPVHVTAENGTMAAVDSGLTAGEVVSLQGE